MPTGTCALCLRIAELQMSHLIPSGAYKALRQPNTPNRHPIFVTEKVTVQTPAQVHDFLLCRSCELRFQQYGEDWVLRNSPRRNGNFPLRNAVMKSTFKWTISSGDVFIEPFDPALDLEKIIYFAASIYWRASVHHWKNSQHLMSRAQLPSEIEEQLRLFLLHENAFPVDAVLFVSISATDPLPHISFPQPMLPKSRSAPAVKAYAFAIPGLQFRLMYENVPNAVKQVSLTLPPHPILVTDQAELEIRQAAEEMRRTGKLVGSLSKSPQFDSDPPVARR